MKKHIALLLALVITAGTLAACAAGVPTGSSSHVPSSSSVASAPPSSVAVSALLPPSASVVSSFPVSSASVPEEGSVLISETDTHSTYQVNAIMLSFSSSENLSDTQESNVSFEITIPKPLFIDDMQIELNLDMKLADIEVLDLLFVDKTISELLQPSELDTLYENDLVVLPNGKELHFSIFRNSYNGDSYRFDFILPINDYAVIAIYYYIFFPSVDYNPHADLTMFEEIMNSIKVIEIV